MLSRRLGDALAARSRCDVRTGYTGQHLPDDADFDSQSNKLLVSGDALRDGYQLSAIVHDRTTAVALVRGNLTLHHADIDLQFQPRLVDRLALVPIHLPHFAFAVAPQGSILQAGIPHSMNRLPRPRRLASQRESADSLRQLLQLDHSQVLPRISMDHLAGNSQSVRVAAVLKRIIDRF